MYRRRGDPAYRIRAISRRIEAWVLVWIVLANDVVVIPCRMAAETGREDRLRGWHGDHYCRGGAGEYDYDYVGPVLHRGENGLGYVRTPSGNAYPDGGKKNVTQGWWTENTERIGEAAHPGPAQPTVAAIGLLRRTCDRIRAAVSYPRPGSGSLRGAVAPGFGGRGDARGGQGGTEAEAFALKVEAVNATGWRALQRRLLATEAQVVLAQETWLTQDAVPAASAWARRRGWQSVWASAIPGPNGGASGGVAVLVRDGIGVHYPPGGSHIWSPGRAVAAVVQAPGHRPTVMVSCYLCHGKGPNGDNLEILAAVGKRLQALSDSFEFVIGGDLNMEPPTLRPRGSRRRSTPRSWLPRRPGAPSAGRPLRPCSTTTSSPTGSRRQLTGSGL